MNARYLFGLILLLLGAGFIAEAIYANVHPGESISIVGMWWPLLVILVGINLLIRQPSRPWGALFVLVLGILLLLRTLGIFPAYTWAMIGALVLIAVGIRLLLPQQRHTRAMHGRTTESTGSNLLNAAVSFGEKVVRDDAAQFQGGNADVSFGSLVVDLRHANLSAEGADLALSANFGSIKVKVPESWPLVVSGSLAFGAVEVRARNAEIAVAGQAALRLACSGAFSGIEITN
ncbi:MAG TPA: LiaF domain-containing protein [Armatimonadota bacterium]|jgi:predicted membrane protein